MSEYFIVFQGKTHGGEYCYGDASITGDGDVMAMKSINILREKLRTENDLASVVILNIIRLPI